MSDAGRRIILTRSAVHKILIGFVLLLGSIFLVLVAWVRVAGTYYVETYKPDHEVEAAVDSILQNRATWIEFADLRMGLEWYTYDNPTINQAPYKLLIYVEPRSEGFEGLVVDSIHVNSSLGTSYEFEQSADWPIVIAPSESQSWRSEVLEPAFDFDFEGEEQIHTRMFMRVLAEDGDQVEVLSIRWTPIRVRHWGPIV